jgi:hypothetical protein
METEELYIIKKSNLEALLAANVFYLKRFGNYPDTIFNYVTDQDIDNAMLASIEGKMVEKINKTSSLDQLLG